GLASMGADAPPSAAAPKNALLCQKRGRGPPHDARQTSEHQRSCSELGSRMDRRDFIAMTAGLLVAPARAQAPHPWRIGYMSFGARPADGLVPASLREGLRDLGYVEGRNAVYIGRWAGAKRERLPELAA